MNTSYFALHKKKLGGVSIALGTPAWFQGPRYPALNPTWDMLSQYHLNRDTEIYTKSYNKEILAPLDPEQVLFDFEQKTALCFEKIKTIPVGFCHRRLVADWIYKETGVYVPEL